VKPNDCYQASASFHSARWGRTPLRPNPLLGTCQLPQSCWFNTPYVDTDQQIGAQRKQISLQKWSIFFKLPVNVNVFSLKQKNNPSQQRRQLLRRICLCWVMEFNVFCQKMLKWWFSNFSSSVHYSDGWAGIYSAKLFAAKISTLL